MSYVHLNPGLTSERHTWKCDAPGCPSELVYKGGISRACFWNDAKKRLGWRLQFTYIGHKGTWKHLCPEHAKGNT